jgi:hypothetical protein
VSNSLLLLLRNGVGFHRGGWVATQELVGRLKWFGKGIMFGSAPALPLLPGVRGLVGESRERSTAPFLPKQRRCHPKKTVGPPPAVQHFAGVVSGKMLGSVPWLGHAPLRLFLRSQDKHGGRVGSRWSARSGGTMVGSPIVDTHLTIAYEIISCP